MAKCDHRRVPKRGCGCGCCPDLTGDWSILFGNITAGGCGDFCGLFDDITYGLEPLVAMGSDVWESTTTITAGPVICPFTLLGITYYNCLTNVRLFVRISGCATRTFYVAIIADIASSGEADCDPSTPTATDEVLAETSDATEYSCDERPVDVDLIWSPFDLIQNCDDNLITLSVA